MSDDLMCVCGDRRSVHRLGRAGCKADDCGCDRFEAAEDQPAAGPAPAALNAEPEIHTRRYGLTELLRRGDTSDDERCRKLAGEVRNAIDALHARLAEVAAEVKARADAEAKVAAARAALDAALAELAALNGGPPDVTTPPSTKE